MIVHSLQHSVFRYPAIPRTLGWITLPAVPPGDRATREFVHDECLVMGVAALGIGRHIVKWHAHGQIRRWRPGGRQPVIRCCDSTGRLLVPTARPRGVSRVEPADDTTENPRKRICYCCHTWRWLSTQCQRLGNGDNIRPWAIAIRLLGVQ